MKFYQPKFEQHDASGSFYFTTSLTIYFYLALPTRAGSSQQHMPITVGAFA
jgi:hypothetical protein